MSEVTYNVNQAQYDVLWDLLSDNDKLPSSSIPALNKALKTEKQNVIGAINEVLEIARKSETTVEAFYDRFNSIVGNEINNPELVTMLNSIDANIIKAIYKVYLEIVGTPDNQINITHIGGSVKEAINNLYEQINKDSEIYEYTDYEEVLEVTDGINFKTTFIPQGYNILFNVNGVIYSKESLEIDRLNKNIKWLFTADNGGFDITAEDCDVSITYDFVYTENGIKNPKLFLDCINANKPWNPLVLVTDELALDAFTEGEAYSYTFDSSLIASGGEAPYKFSILSGNIPKGLTFNENNYTLAGVLESGLASEYKFIVKVVDSSEPYFTDYINVTMPKA